MLIKKIDTKLSAFEIYSIFEKNEYSFFLDSGMDREKLGQFSFIGFDPFLVFKSKEKNIKVTQNGVTVESIGDPFDKLKELLKKYNMDYKTDLPFIGGAVGYFGYDLCHHIEKLPRTAVDDVEIPDCFIGFYDGVIIIDHRNKEVYIVSLGIKDASNKIVERIEKQILNNLPNISEDDTKENLNHAKVELKSNFKKSDYLKAVNTVKDYIRAGDIYQANLTQRFEGEFLGNALELYERLRNINPAPFASFIDFGEGKIISSSPERFIKVKDRYIETRPIKGTINRGKTEAEDKQNREKLLSSEKDKAELLMIVDLERNDIGKISKTGTVKVTELFGLEKYPTVYHLVSTVVGEIKDEFDTIDCIKATFPGGSITGAPKIRAMEIIDELEPTQRNIYTGSIGYIGFNGDADLNIAIRTIICKGERVFFQVGGGIVFDSDAEAEYEETLHKARALIESLEAKVI